MKNQFSPFNPPANYWKKSRFQIVQLIINGLLKSSVVVGSYYWVKNLSSQIRNQQEINTHTIVYLLIAAGLIVALRVHERYVSEKMSQRYINSLRSGLLKRLMRASVRNIQARTIGNLSSRLAGDLSALKRWLSLGISRLITHSLLLLLTTLLVFKINASLGVVISLTLMALLALSVLVGGFLKNSIRVVRRNRIAIHSLLVERLSSLATIRSMGKEGREVARINKQAKKLEKNIAKQGVFLGFIRGIGDSSSLILISVFFVFNGLNNHVLALDEITALISIILFLNSPIRELGRTQEYYQGAKLSIAKIEELYAIPRIVRGKSSHETIEKDSASIGRIELRNTTVKETFKQLSVRAQNGEHIALTGTNGSGKSTLIQIVLGLIKVDSGFVRVNGCAPNKTPSLDRANHIGFASAEAGLIKGTLLENLCYRKGKENLQGFDELMEFCQLNNLVKKLPKGLNTRILEKGKNLSSGEKARILLFRALLGKPAILILDEPESYLDKQGLEIIKSLLEEYKGTILMATHNIELIKLCHKEWNMDSLKKNKSPVRLINDYAENK